MPPVGYFASATSTYDVMAGTCTLLTPSAVRTNDVLLALLAAPTTSTITPPAGWVEIASVPASGPVPVSMTLYRRIAAAAEPAQHVFAGTPGVTPHVLGILLLYRGLDRGAAIVDNQSIDVNPGNTAYPAPSITLQTYSDLALFVYFNQAATPPDWTPAAGTTARATNKASSGTGSLFVADQLVEAVGPTGTRTATASQSGIGHAAAFALKAEPTLPAPSIVPDVAGAIGLPTVGV
jgi:hypothetical protein